jgi:hypothetical protein
MVHLNNYGSTLYNLKNDLGETKNLSEIDTIHLNQLTKKMNAWNAKMINPLWLEEPEWMEVTYEIHQNLMENKPVLRKAPDKQDETSLH